MFGAKVYRRREVIQALTRAMVEMGSDPNKSHDQKTLANIFWPTVKDDAVRFASGFFCIHLFCGGRRIRMVQTRKPQAISRKVDF